MNQSIHKIHKTTCLASALAVALVAAARDFHVDAREGDDARDGLSAETAWRTIERAAKQKLGPGDRLLLRAGCVWRLARPFQVKASGRPDAPVLVTRYGEGAAPELRASLDGLALEWLPEKDGLWSAACDGPDVGNIVWNGGCGFKKARLSDVKDDGDFFHDKATGRLLLKWPQHPKAAFGRMEICRKINILQVGYSRNLTIDGVAAMFTGAHGLCGCPVSGLTVRNCAFGWIGGSFLCEPGAKANRPDGVRYGNGIEFWARGASRDIRIERNIFHDIYDTAMTNQGREAGELDGMAICSNRTERCEQSYEYWFTGGNYKVGLIDIFDNTFNDAGYGWSHAQRPNKNATHVLSYSVSGPKGRIVLRGNRFGRTKQCAIWLFGDGARDWLDIGENDWHESGKIRWREGKAWKTEPPPSTKDKL